AALVYDELTNQRFVVPSEAGHIGFQPKNRAELRYLQNLWQKYPNASAEFALSGKHGFNNLMDKPLLAARAPKLARAVNTARQNDQPIGVVLSEFARLGKGSSKRMAQGILMQMGNMVGSLLRDYAVTFKATGGVYLTGSVSHGIGEYLAEHTGFNKRFVCEGAVHAEWLKDVPICLIDDPHIAVVGALALAKG
ncbi:MAG: glk, partial [Candidatus Saccharibacteria bacterium]|nr:glk [Candidatus Saccharibacteria bacterium]